MIADLLQNAGVTGAALLIGLLIGRIFPPHRINDREGR